MPSAVRHRVEIVSTRDLSPTVRELTLELPARRTFSFAAGQYVHLYVPTDGGLVFKRPYSIASTPSRAAESPARVEIAVTRVEGPTSAALHALPVGTRFDLEGPRGTFVRHWRDEASLFVATGTGLAPLRSMIAEELARGDDAGPPMLLLFGCRTEADILWRDQLEQWRRDYPRFRLEVTLSRGDPPWAGRRGYVQTHLREVLADTREAASAPPRVYVCGVADMVLDVVDVLERRLGAPRDKLHYETYD